MFSNFFKCLSFYILICTHQRVVASGWSIFGIRPHYSHDLTVILPKVPTTTTTHSSTPTTIMTSPSTLFTTESSETTTNLNTELPMDKKSESSQTTQTTQAAKMAFITELLTSDDRRNKGLGGIQNFHPTPFNKEDKSGLWEVTSKTVLSITTTPFTTTIVTTQPSTITTTKPTPTPTPTTTPSSTTTTSTTTTTTTSTTTISPTTQDPISSSANSKDEGYTQSFRSLDNNGADSVHSTVEPSDLGPSNFNDNITTSIQFKANETTNPEVTNIANNKTHLNASDVSHEETIPEYDATRENRGLKENGTESTEKVITDSTSTMESVTIKVNTTISPIPTTSQPIVAIDSIARRVNTNSANSIGSYQFLSILLFSLLITQISL